MENEEPISTCSMTLRHVRLDFRKKKEPRKTAAQYQEEYRTRLKCDPRQWEAYKEKQRQYSKNYLKNLSEEDVVARKAKKAHNQRNYRKKKKEEANMVTSSVITPLQQPKKKTRKQVNDQRTYWREAKRQKRALLTPGEKEQANEKERLRKQRKRHEQRLAALAQQQCGDAQAPQQCDVAQAPQQCSVTEAPQQCSDAQVQQQCSVAQAPQQCGVAQAPQQCSVTEAPQQCSVAQAPQPSCTTNSSQPRVFSTPSPTKNSKYSSLKRIKKVLPKSKKVKKYVIKGLVDSTSPATKRELLERLRVDLLSEDITSSVKDTSVKRHCKDSAVKVAAVSFFYENSLELPNLKFFSKRLNKQRKVLNKPVQILYQEFCVQHPDLRISRRNFYRCRPKDVLLMKSLKFLQCLCETCENVRLITKCLSAAGSQYSSVSDALRSTLCPYQGEWPSIECVQRKCKSCGTHLLEDTLRANCDLTANVTYECWDRVTDIRCKGKKTQLVKKSCSLGELVHVFCNLFKTFSLHRHTDKWQRQQFINLKRDMPPTSALIVLDFAENYVCNFQNQAQSAYYSLNQVTIHPVVIYSKCTCGKLVTSYRMYISDDLKHDAAFVDFVLCDTLESLNCLSKFFVFSDNCCSQYKSRLPLYHLSQLSKDYNIERCFFGERHGKSECDSSGGVVKSFLKQSVASGQAVLTNASDIVDHLNSHFQLRNLNCSHSIRTFHLVNTASIDRGLTTADVLPVEGVKQFHSFRMFKGCLGKRQFSCFCKQCLSEKYQHCLSKALPGFKTDNWPHSKKCGGMEYVEESGGDVEEAYDGVGNVEESGENVEEACDGVGNVEESGENMEEAGDGVGNMEESGDNMEEAGDGVGNVEESGENMEEAYDGVGNVEESGDNVEEACDGVGNVEESGENMEEAGDGVGNVEESGDNMEEAGGGVEAVVKNVRRKLFVSEVNREGNNKLFIRGSGFKKLYSKLLQCKSFNDIVDVCGGVNFDPLEINPKMSKINPDFQAYKILKPALCPAGYLPHVTVADGNCVPRSLSILIFGNENHHLEMRCRIIKELSTNKHLYLNSDFLAEGSFNDKSTILSKLVALSDSIGNFNMLDPDHAVSVFEAEVFDTRLLGTFLGPWHLHAAAQIMNCPIISLYPDLGPLLHSEILARAFVPSATDYRFEPLYVLWTSNRNDMKNKHWVANHVVPMVKLHNL